MEYFFLLVLDQIQLFERVTWARKTLEKVVTRHLCQKKELTRVTLNTGIFFWLNVRIRKCYFE